MHFNKNIKVCDWPNDAKCTSCDLTTTSSPTTTTKISSTTTLINTTTPQSTTTTTQEINTNQTTIEPTTTSASEITTVPQNGDTDWCIEDDCPIIESGETELNLTLLAIPYDCTKYIICQRGVKYIM